MKQATIIRLDSEQRTRLDFIAQSLGVSVAALIRWCVEKSLPELEKEKSQEVKA